MRYMFVALVLCCGVLRADDFTRVFEAKPSPEVPKAPIEVDPPSWLDCVVKLRDSRGAKSSGVNVKQGVLTCWHCVKDGGPVVHVECGNEKADARLIYKDEKNDIALLAVNWKELHRAVSIASEDVKVGDRLFSLGRGTAGLLTAENHTVTNIIFGAEWFGVDNPFVQGRSGGPVLRADGSLVGIVRAVDINREPYTGMAVPAGPVRDLINSVPKPFRAIMWSPSWCGVCIGNDRSLREFGHPSVLYECRKGDEKTFPKDVNAYAAGGQGQPVRGWPVWQIECADGQWCFVPNARTFDDLIAIHNSGPNKPIPPSTYGKAVK